MDLYETVSTLEYSQLLSVSKTLGVPRNYWGKATTVKHERILIRQSINSKLKEYYKKRTDQKFCEPHEILSLWRDDTLLILKAKKFKPENQARKEVILKELKQLHTRAYDSDLMVSVVRDILLLLWQEANKKEKEKFLNIVKKELDKHHLKFTEKELNDSFSFLLMGGVGGAVPIAVPIVASVMLQQFTKGFIAWFAINVMGRKAAQVALLGWVSGPVGWAIAVGTGGLSAVWFAIRFKDEQDKLRFIQAILSIYAFRYQDQLNKRREND